MKIQPSASQLTPRIKIGALKYEVRQTLTFRLDRQYNSIYALSFWLLN